MPKEKSAGAIIFRVTDKGLEYILLHCPSSPKAKKGYWDFPKGHMEKGEAEEDTVRREVREETGLEDIELLKGFREVISYWFRFQGKTVSKTVIFYLARAKTQEVTLSSEHIGYQWLLYEEALLQLTYENAKELLKKAQAFLKKKA
ncbi:MAG: NUDIX domain-containing protein [Patescibacteria group bacterium]